MDVWTHIADGESNLLERKPKSVNADGYRKTIVAFANSVPRDQEAVLFIGVGDKGEIIGCSETDSLQKKIRAFCESECYPPIKYRTEVRMFDGKEVLAIVVPHSSTRPHFSGAAYVRVGSESKTANEQQYREFVASRSEVGATLLSYKDQIVTVVAINKHLGDTRLIGKNRESAECKILEVDSQFVRFEKISSTRRVSEPLAYISIARDEEKWRPLVIVEKPSK